MSGPELWSGRTVARPPGYVFRHALYREALYEGIPAANRQGLHERIGSRLETAFKAQAAEMAPVLANHFERAADHRRAAIYRGLSGLTALKRGAANDAAGQFRRPCSPLRPATLTLKRVGPSVGRFWGWVRH